MILDERYFNDFGDWAARITQFLARYGTVPQAVRDEDWRRWAVSLSLLPVLSGQPMPSPYNYSDWKSWAAPFNMAVNLPAG